MTVHIVMAVPTKDDEGYLLFLKQILASRVPEFQEKLAGGDMTPELVDQMVDVLMPFVREPADRDEARATLWKVSQNQFTDMLNALTGGAKAEDVVPPTSG